MRLRSRQHLRDIRRAGAVTAANPVVPQQPYVAEPSDRLIGHFRNTVGIRQTARSQRSEDGLELIRLEADQVEVKTAEIELAELVAELLGLPARPRRQLIVGQAISTLFVLAPAARDDHGDVCKPQPCRRMDARMASEQHTQLIGQHRHRPSPFEDGGGNLVEIGFGMKSAIVRVGS